MTNKKQLQKLELIWIGKGEEPKLEPRILIENPEYSYGDPNCENMLIHGDNLLALKALEQDYAGKVKCIYIDPPYNTGNAFEHYDDNLEHSIWLNLIFQRIKILYSLMSKDGAFCIHLDDQEVHYAKVVCDEIFGRNNFISTIAIKSSTPSGVKTSHKDKKIIKQKDLLLVYKKSDELRINPQYVRKSEWDTHFNYFINSDNKTVSSFLEVLKKNRILTQKQSIRDFDINNEVHRDFYIKNADKICQTQSHKNIELKEASRKLKDEILHTENAMFYNGRQLTPLSNSLNNVVYRDKIEKDFALLLCDFWSDIDFQNTQNEGGVEFPNSKKPEFLIQRILALFTETGDLVLDSFLGSGTTAAIAHKMGRRYIGIELGDHAKTHCYPRLKAVVDGEQGGISKAVNWQGGGGFKFYTLAPSLLKQDKFGNWVISQEYNADMLAAAMAKQEGFKYQPHESSYWKQGQSSEQDFIFTTTQFLTIEALDSIKDEMQPGETLMICCKSFQKECKGKYANITIKKIPQMLLGRCEYGKEDYSLNIINLPVEREDEEAEDAIENTSVQAISDSKKKNDQPSLF
ncbi:MAG: site-specific DNA-methyltransferase [Saprospiraceae bacterium]